MKNIFKIGFLIIINSAFSQAITDTGTNVGIGTSTPDSESRLHVESLSGISDFTILATSAGINNWSGFYKDASNNFFIQARNGLGVLTSNLASSGDSWLNGGNLGIGTLSPSEKLQVNGLIRISTATNEENNSPGIVLASNDDFLFDGQFLNHYGFGFHGYNDGSTTYTEPSNTYISGYFGVDFFTSGQNRMRISHDGIVSIGTVNRQIGYKLAVNGNIKAKEIKVETGWSDFVFENNYYLPTLKEVELYIKEEGHLKDIPSAEEVKTNGIFLGDMNAKLLQKIEELTLYTIQQEKRIENLESKNDSLLKLIEDLLNIKIEE